MLVQRIYERPAPSILGEAFLRPAALAIAFEETPHTWWRYILRRRYHHAMVLLHDGYHWIVFNPGQDRWTMAALQCDRAARYRPTPEDVGPLVIEVVDLDVDRLPWNETKRMRVPWLLGLLTCVGAIKAILGVRAPLVWTPHRLRKHVEAQGWVEASRRKAPLKKS